MRPHCLFLTLPDIPKVEPKHRLKPLFELYKHQTLSSEETRQKTLRDLQKQFDPKEFKIIRGSVETFAPIKNQLDLALNIFYEVKKHMVEYFVSTRSGTLNRPESMHIDSTNLAKYLDALKDLVMRLKRNSRQQVQRS